MVISFSEFRRFVGNQQECQRKWRDAETELDRIKEKVKALEEENSLLKTKLRHAHVQIEREADERRRIEHNKLELVCFQLYNLHANLTCSIYMAILNLCIRI